MISDHKIQDKVGRMTLDFVRSDFLHKSYKGTESEPFKSVKKNFFIHRWIFAQLTFSWNEQWSEKKHLEESA